MQEITADAIVAESVSPVSEIKTSTDLIETEEQLSAEITELWAVHTDAQSFVKKTQAELKLIRQRLGESLHQMKQILAKPGCQGGWSSFLEQHQISRTTADRLVLAHQTSLNPNVNGTTGSFPEMTDEQIAGLVKAVWSKLRKKLGTKSAVYRFLAVTIAESGLANFKFHRGDVRGLAVVDPDATSTSETAAATTDTSAAAPTNEE